jgi:hypothetical protein
MRLAGLALMLVTVGCANHVRYLDVQKDHVDTVVLQTRYGVVGGDAAIKSPRLQLEFYRIDHFEDRTERTTIKYEEATPYLVWHELYEVPLGLVSVPLSIAFNALHVALLFYIPGDLVDGYTSWTFAALNPLMNAENPDRVARMPIEAADTRRLVEERQVRQPYAEAPVQARFDAGAETELVADGQGVLRLHLLDAVSTSMGPRPRRLIVELTPPADSGLAQEFFVPRDLARRLGEARHPMLIVRGDRQDPRELGEAIYRLDRLGFVEYSVVLEDELLNRNVGDDRFVREFRDSLDALYEPGPDAAPAGHSRAPAATP